jgi:hypothetical protein
MNEPWTHDSDDDYIEPDQKQVTKSGRLLGWCAIVVVAAFMISPIIRFIINLFTR